MVGKSLFLSGPLPFHMPTENINTTTMCLFLKFDKVMKIVCQSSHIKIHLELADDPLISLTFVQI